MSKEHDAFSEECFALQFVPRFTIKPYRAALQTSRSEAEQLLKEVADEMQQAAVVRTSSLAEGYLEGGGVDLKLFRAVQRERCSAAVVRAGSLSIR